MYCKRFMTAFLLLLIGFNSYCQDVKTLILNRTAHPIYSWNTSFNHFADSMSKGQATYMAGDYADKNTSFTLVLKNNENASLPPVLYVCRYKSDSVFVGGGIGINQSPVINDASLIIKVGDVEYKVVVNEVNNSVKISKVSADMAADLELIDHDVLPDASITLLYGGKVSLKSYEHSAPYIYLEFWGTWCGHCIPTMDDLKKVYDKYHNKVTVISIAFNEPAADDQVVDTNDIRKVVEFHHADWVQAIANTYIRRLFYLNGAPYGILYDTYGNVIKRYMTVQELDKFLENK